MLAERQEPLGLSKTPKGVRPKRCSCRLIERRIKEVIENGLKICRVRFGLPAGELPYLEPSRLSIYLLSLLTPSLPSRRPIPRTQRGTDPDGFPIFARLGRMERWRLASAVASIKRILPNQICEAHPPPSRFPSWSARQCGDPRVSTPEYQQFARRLAVEVLPAKWDSTYRSFCRTFVTKIRSRAEKAPCGMPVDSNTWWSQMYSRQEYLSVTRDGAEFHYDHPSRYKEVPTVGKLRPMIVPSASLDILGPLHKTLYENMASQPWILKGKPSVQKLSGVLGRKWKTSIDLVNASDGLTLDVADIFLDVAQSSSRHVPAGIFEKARRSLRPLFTYGNEDPSFHRITNGQMMGQYLSFPLLCFQSYVAARWATRGLDAEIRINGDDALIGCDSPDVIHRYPPHLEINRDKTAVRENVAEVNSTQFIRWGGKWKEVVTARRLGGSSLELDGLVHMARSCLGGGDRWVSAFVRTRIGRRSRVSPVHLGLPMTNRDVFWRHRGMPSYRVLPTDIAVQDDRLEKTEEKPSFEEAEAFRTLLFNEGRFKPRRDDPWKVKNLPYRPSAVSTVYVRDAFARHRRIEMAEKKEKKEIYFRVRRDPEPVCEPISPYQGVHDVARQVNEQLVEVRLHERTLVNPIKVKEREVVHLMGRSR